MRFGVCVCAAPPCVVVFLRHTRDRDLDRAFGRYGRIEVSVNVSYAAEYRRTASTLVKTKGTFVTAKGSLQKKSSDARVRVCYM